MSERDDVHIGIHTCAYARMPSAVKNITGIFSLMRNMQMILDIEFHSQSHHISGQENHKNTQLTVYI